MGYHKGSGFSLFKFIMYLVVIFMVGTICYIPYALNKYNYLISKENIEEEKKSHHMCENLSAKIILESKVQDIKQADNKLVLLTAPESGMQQIIIFDYCQNKIINDLFIEIKDKKAKDIGEVEFSTQIMR